MSFLHYDKWRTAILHISIDEVIKHNHMDGSKMTLLPDDGSYRFLADPFGIWEGDKLYIFVESYDYRDAKGVIDVLIYNKSYILEERRCILEEDWHLSYPYIFKFEEDYYLLPEAYKSGKISLYKAKNFPFEWEIVKDFSFPVAAIDATPLFFQNKWWIFYTPSSPKEYRQSALNLAVSEELIGEWRVLGSIHLDRAGARAGGTPHIIEDKIYLPVQDCERTYGGGIRFLEIILKDEKNIKISSFKNLVEIPSALYPSYPDGLHTLSSTGRCILIDVKKIKFGLKHQLYHFMRRFKR